MPIERLRSPRPEIHLLDIAALKAHERVIATRLLKIKSALKKSGEVRTPLWVEREHLIVLNGHHRLGALRELGCRYAPAILLDYSNDDVRVGVCPGAKIASIDKRSIIAAALTGNLLPARSSLHVLSFLPGVRPTPLAALKH
ncbi:MAG: ParB N-terminal domain-containing protein [Elusimicrobia bacterium]|nr:ParB N-terminal domain-containing protein [Elusimicrobiota bacterium]